MLSRRAFVGRLAAGAAVAGAVTTVGSRAPAGATMRLDGGAMPDPVAARIASAPSTASGSCGAPAPSAAAAVAGTGPTAAAPWGLLAPLAAGAAVGEGWQVAELGPVQAGASVLTLAHASGRTRRIHLCRNGGAPVGLVHTGAVDLVVMNGGAGEEPTEESLAQAVATVAHAVARNEAAADVAAVGLLAHAERLERFGASAQLR